MRKTKAMERLEGERGKPIELLILEAINTEGNLRLAADRLGIDYTTLSKWTSGLDIQIRPFAVLPEQEALSSN